MSDLVRGEGLKEAGLQAIGQEKTEEIIIRIDLKEDLMTELVLGLIQETMAIRGQETILEMVETESKVTTLASEAQEKRKDTETDL